MVKIWVAIRNGVYSGICGLLLVSPLALSAEDSPARETQSGHIRAKLSPNTVSRWQGTMTRDTSKSAGSHSGPTKAPAETLSFFVTTNGDREPTAVDLSFTGATATLDGANELQCFTGGNVTGQGRARPPFIFSDGGDGFFFSFSDLTGESFFNGVNGGGVLEGMSFDFDTGDPLELDINQAQGNVNFQYQFSLNSDQYCTPDAPAPGGTCSLPCTWLWEAQCVENCDGNGQIRFAESAYEIDETEDAIEVTVQRVEGAIGETTVEYRTAIIGTGKGFAASGIDYQFTSGTFTWMDGENDDKTITIPISDDTVIEGPEDFRVELSNVTGGATLGDPSQTTITIEDRPDLTIDEFMIDTGTLVRENERYVFKDVEVFVRNVAEGGQAATNVVITVTDNGSFQAISPSFGPIEPGEIWEDPFKFDYDVTSVLSAGSGEATFELTATADIDDDIPERDPDTTNSYTEEGDLDVRPKILEPLQPVYDVDGAFFLDRPFSNEITVRVDWNGPNLAGIGEQPFGQVVFDYNGEVTKIDGTPNAIDTLIQDDYMSVGLCEANSFVFGAELGDFEAEPVSVASTLFDFPTWILWLIDFIPFVDSDFTVMPKPSQGVIVYDYNFIFPDPAFEILVTVPEAVPYVGGLTGITETQATVKARYDSSDKGNASVSGQTGITAAGKVATVELLGEGVLKYNCMDNQLGLGPTTIGLKLGAGISIEKGLIEVIPIISSATQWPIVGSAVQWLTNAAKVTALVVPQAGVTVTFEPDEAGAIDFTAIAGQLGLLLQATLALEPFDSLTFSITGGGSIEVQVKYPQPFFDKATVSLMLGAVLEVWRFGGEFTVEAVCMVPGACNVDTDSNLYPAIGRLRLLPRDHIKGDYARFNAGLHVRRGVSAADLETTLVSNTYPRPSPDLAIRPDGQRTVVYVHDDPNDPNGRSTEIRSVYFDGSQWNAPVDVSDDQQADFAPAVAYDGSNNAVLVWERSKLATDTVLEFLDSAFAQSLEIYSAVWNGTSWSAPLALTDDDQLDHAPRIASAADGSVLAVWKSNPGLDLTGTAASPMSFKYATWNGTQWSAVDQVAKSLERVLQFDIAAGSATDATLLVMRDAGTGDFLPEQTEIFYSSYNGAGWSALMQLTNNAVGDERPAVAYDAVGSRHLFWVSDGDLLWLKDSLNAAEAQVIRSESSAAGVLDFRVVNDATGNLAIIWPEASQQGTNTAYVIYDQAADTWGASQALQSDFGVEGFAEAAFAPDGSLHLVYGKTEIDFETQQVAAGGDTATIDQLAVSGETDLVHFQHVLGVDAAAKSIAFSPSNVQQGDDYTLNAVVQNTGDFEIASLEVNVYDGATLIHNQTLAALAGGEEATVSFDGTLSEAQLQTFRLVVDPAASIAEKDETNNEVTQTLAGPAFEVFFRDSFQFDR